MNPAAQAKLDAERKLKEGISGHRTGLPKKLLELFAPLDPLKTLHALKKPRTKLPYTGIGSFVDLFAQAGDDEYEPPPESDRPPSPRKFRNPELRLQARVDSESRAEKKERVVKDLEEAAKDQIAEGMKHWNPGKDPNAQSDPFKTLFVSRISYDVTEKKLRREFEEFGPIKHIRLVHDKNTDKPRGYAFIEFEHKNDMKQAYKMADGKKIEGRRVVVDVERGRTVPGWQPRRLGGGKGGDSRVYKEPKNAAKRISAGLPPAPSAPGPPAVRDAPRPEPRDRDRDRPPPPAPRPDRPEPRDRDRDRDRDRPPPPRERERERERPVVPPPADGHRDRGRDRDRDRDREKDRDRDRGRDVSDRERGRDSDRKRERGYEDDRSSKRHREDDRGTRRRERDLV